MKTKILVLFAALLLAGGAMVALLYTGVIHINNPSRKQYPIRGVDVSHYQGEIDWERLAKEDIRFAYIKATEGSKYKDDHFDQNWSEAQKSGLRIGAYHFFSLDSAGTTQVEGMLPPVVDIEPYGNYNDTEYLDKDKMFTELAAYMKAVESFYGMKPVIYTTEDWWSVLQEEFAEYDLWIRNVYGKPDPSTDWTFWQYSNRHVLSGYSGAGRYIDMNAFCGDEKEFDAY